MYTIAAIATPHAAGGISVIRISGDSAVSVAQTCFCLLYTSDAADE